MKRAMIALMALTGLLGTRAHAEERATDTHTERTDRTESRAKAPSPWSKATYAGPEEAARATGAFILTRTVSARDYAGFGGDLAPIHAHEVEAKRLGETKRGIVHFGVATKVDDGHGLGLPALELRSVSVRQDPRTGKWQGRTGARPGVIDRFSP